MKFNEQQDFVPISDLARPGTDDFNKLRAKATKIGALILMGSTEYIDIKRWLSFQAQEKQTRIDNRRETKKALKESFGRYGNINSIAKLNVIERQINKAIQPRNSKIDQLTKMIDAEKDDQKLEKLNAERDRLVIAAEDAEVKLSQLANRREAIKSSSKSSFDKRRKAKSESSSPKEKSDN